jgi:NAD+ kinase
VRAPRVVTVFTHRRPDETGAALSALCRAGARAGVELRFSPEETAKHGLSAGGACVVDAPVDPEADLCLVLGGDGTILHALRTYVGTGVPVYAVNFGEVGFLATVDPVDMEVGLERALRGEFEVLELPSIALRGPRGAEPLPAINDVSFQRKHGLRVADLAYAVGDDEVGRVRCDGLVVATPAGSTGYNLANGGPVMAWGVEGFVVSFIAPHSLTARALVIAPGDTITVSNRSREEPADITVDGRPAGQLDPGESYEVSFSEARAALAQTPGASFYHRLREKFGRLATEV